MFERSEFGDKQMNGLFVLNSESDWRELLCNFSRKVATGSSAVRTLEK
ncbi:MAG: hypothetical protein VE98_C0001G0055 [candidate division Kazan bacterium GW2011_GWA1_50_15]|uniref:Uncharacterized protein n=1 Tax=candidate division Kazan bacterium GW2011_GWA1_50_15 TaxID=1620412 RepID=A0A0G4BBS9_UNCK3|nr:MAG: hypothetical protein VE98_C0001G0055 [candidate division Kazan bacterium GW2011_GWA1_50_15]